MTYESLKTMCLVPGKSLNRAACALFLDSALRSVRVLQNRYIPPKSIL
jgi:hypothetical protein